MMKIHQNSNENRFPVERIFLKLHCHYIMDGLTKRVSSPTYEGTDSNKFLWDEGTCNINISFPIMKTDLINTSE